MFPRRAFLCAAALAANLCLCSTYPTAGRGTDLPEIESVWQYLRAYSVWQDSIPLAPNPFVFAEPEQLLASVNDTFHGANYTRYDSTTLPHGAVPAAAAAGAAESTVFWWRLTDSTALVRITGFKPDTTLAAFRAAASFLASYPKIIVDVRDNRGGNIDAVDSIIEYFLPAGTTFISAKYRKYDASSRTASTTDWISWTTSRGRSPTLAAAKVAVLTNGFTASASEILAAGLKDGRLLAGLDTVTLVGETTFGKGMGQVVVSRTYLGRRDIKITFLRLDGLGVRTKNYHRRGIAPDVAVTGPLAQINAALRVLEPSAAPLAGMLLTAAAREPRPTGAYVLLPADTKIEN